MFDCAGKRDMRREAYLSARKAVLVQRGFKRLMDAVQLVEIAGHGKIARPRAAVRERTERAETQNERTRVLHGLVHGCGNVGKRIALA